MGPVDRRIDLELESDYFTFGCLHGLEQAAAARSEEQFRRAWREFPSGSLRTGNNPAPARRVRSARTPPSTARGNRFK